MQLFFEWALDSKFNKSQRQTLNQLLIEEWKSGNQSDIKDTLKLMAIPSNLNKFSADEQKVFHDKLQVGLVEQIEQQPDNALSKLLADVRKNEDVLNQKSNGVIPESNATTVNSSDFTGEWLYRISGSSITYTNGAGSYADPSGELTGYKIRANGTYEHGYLMSSSLYSCNIKLFGFETGVWSVQGNTIIFQDKTAHVSIKDTCNPSKNKEKAGTLNRTVYQYRFERDEYGLKLVLGESPFYQQKPGEMGW
jgi:hypothetical protein